MRRTLVKVEAEVEFHVFSSIHSTNVDMKSEAFLAGYLEKYYHVNYIRLMFILF